MSNTLWITGAAGFTGRHLSAVVATVAGRPRIVGVDIAPSANGELDDYVCADVCDAAAVEALARRLPPRWVVHLAGVTSAPTAAQLWEGNVRGVTGLLLGLASAGCQGVRLLGIGSAAEYAPTAGRRLTERAAIGPLSEYGKAKLAQTTLTLALGRRLGVDTCVARTFNLVGPGLPSSFVAGRLAEQFARRGPRGDVRVAHTASGRDFVDVRDAADAYWRLVRRGQRGEIYNVCSGQPVMIGELVDRLAAISGTTRSVRTDASVPADVDRSVVFGSYAKLRRHTEWVPRFALNRSLEDMLHASSGPQPIARERRVAAAAASPARVRTATASSGSRR